MSRPDQADLPAVAAPSGYRVLGRKTLYGVVHLSPLPGTPFHRPGSLPEKLDARTWREKGLSMLEGSSSMNQSRSTKSTKAYFLELYGEPSPKVDPEYFEVLATRGKSNAGPTYEYFWTLGKYEQPSERPTRSGFLSRIIRFFLRKGSAGTDWGELSHRSFAQVYMLFPRSSGWRVHELAVSVKYLAPVDKQKTVLQEMGKDIAALQPLLGVAGTAVSAAGAAAGAGPAASATGHVLDAMAKMKVGSVPQTKDFNWSVRKVSIQVGKDDTKPADGVVWNLPLSMLESLGSRINGSIAVCLVPLPDPNMENRLCETFQAGNVWAWATLPLRTESKTLCVSSAPLRLTPHAPRTSQGVMPGHQPAPAPSAKPELYTGQAGNYLRIKDPAPGGMMISAELTGATTNQE